jgi:ABC-type glycerol-3-phosphate transport system substrate-binding protein
MQQQCHFRLPLFSILRNYFLRTNTVRGCALLLALACLSCGETRTTLDRAPEQPHRGKSLRIVCSSAIDARLVRQFAQEWSVLHQVDVKVATAADQRSAGDIAIVTAAELPAFAESGRFAAVPDAAVPESIRGREHSYHWDSVLQSFTDVLASWNGVTYGVPLLGEGYVLVYRRDHFRDAGLPAPPATWKDFVEDAKALAKKFGRPSLPALPKTPLALETEFHLIAACYDRPAQRQGDMEAVLANEAQADRLYSYHYRLANLEPRLGTSAFVHTFNLLREMRPLRAAANVGEGDAFGVGRAALAIVSLADVARFQAVGSPVRGLFGIAPLPGAETVFDLDGNELKNRRELINHVPYFGAGCWVGLVGNECADPGLAFDFLAAFADPEKMGAETIAAAKWGAGPFRSSQTEATGRGLWFGYDLPPADTEQLLTALKQNLAQGIINRRFPLRVPNRQQHVDLFDKIVRPALQADQADAKKTLDAVDAAWKQLWDGVPEVKKRAWIRHAHGL